MSATPAPQQPPPTSGPSSTAAKSGVPVARPARQFFRVHADPDDLLTPRRVSRWIVIAGLLFSSVVHTLIIVILMFLVFGGSGQKGNSVLDMDLTNPGDVLDFTRAEDLDEPLNAPNMEITAAQDIPTQPEITEPLLTDREGPGPGPSPKVAADASAFKVTRIGNNAEQLQGVKIKVGDPQFTLIWNTKADLDLHVREPGGAEIYWSSRKGKLGGELDVDDVDGFGPENIFWNKRVSESGVTVLGQGPPGKYQWFVRYYGGYAGFSQPTRWKVRVKHNGKETVHEGQLKRIGERSKVFTLTNGDSGGPDAGDAAVENPAESVPDTVMDAANADNPDNPDKPRPDQPKPDLKPKPKPKPKPK